MTDRKLMQQALEALCFGLHVGFDESSESHIKKGGKAFDQHSKAITALRERLAREDALDRMSENARELGLAQPWTPDDTAYRPGELPMVEIETVLTVQPEQEIDWKDQYEKQKRRAEMWRDKYEAVAGPDECVYPAQPEQQPLTSLQCANCQLTIDQLNERVMQLMRTVKPLTDEQIRKWWASENCMEDFRMSKLDDFAKVVRAIEAAHGITEETK